MFGFTELEYYQIQMKKRKTVALSILSFSEIRPFPTDTPKRFTPLIRREKKKQQQLNANKYCFVLIVNKL